MAVGSYGIIRPSDVSPEDVEIYFHYVADRNSTSTVTLKKLSSVEVLTPVYHNSNTTNDYTVVALVSPFKDLREKLKNDGEIIVKEIYLHSSRTRDGKMVEYYEPPTNNYLDIDTDKYTIKESLKLIIDYIK